MKNKNVFKLFAVSLFALVCAVPVGLSAQVPSGDPPPKPTPPPPPSDAKAVLPVTPAVVTAKPDAAAEAKIDKDPVNNPDAKTNAPVAKAPAPVVSAPPPPPAPVLNVDAVKAVPSVVAPPAVEAPKETPKEVPPAAPAAEKK